MIPAPLIIGFNNNMSTNEIHQISMRDVRYAVWYDCKIIGFLNSIQYIFLHVASQNMNEFLWDFRWQVQPIIIYQGRRMQVLKKWNVAGVVILESRSFHQKPQWESWQVLYGIECCRWRRSMFYCLALLSFCQDIERISSFIVLPSSKRIYFDFSLFFTVNVIDWLKNYF